jgi:hypothetical protein
MNRNRRFGSVRPISPIARRHNPVATGTWEKSCETLRRSATNPCYSAAATLASASAISLVGACATVAVSNLTSTGS